jgi:hypothetical protein
MVWMLPSYNACIGLAALFLPFAASALDWPQEIKTSEGTIVVYQPQPESFKGNF